MTFEMRPYQSEAIAETREAYRSAMMAPLICAPTGAGKTAIFAEIMKQTVEKHAGSYQTLFTCPRRELVGQTVAALRRVGIEPSVIMAGADDAFDPEASVHVASLDTLIARYRKGRDGVPGLDPKLIVVDECHLAVSDKRIEVLSRWPAARLLGLTATPGRLDNKPLGRAHGGLFDAMVKTCSIKSLIDQGYLVPGRYYAAPEQIDLTKVKKTAGDYNLGQLEAVMMPLVGGVVRQWQKLASDRRTIVFATRISHSQALVAEFIEAGVTAEHVDANTPTAEREAIFDRFRSGETQVLSNCFLASYGFDLPDLDCVVLARPTKSLVLYLQMIGRGLRPAEGKTDCLVLDHGGLIVEHGFAEDPREWSLDGDKAVTTQKVKHRECPDCGHVFTPPKDWNRECPLCGHYFPPRKPSQREVIQSDLVEVNGAVLPGPNTYGQLRGLAEAKGYKPGFAKMKYRDWFGNWPARAWDKSPPIEPDFAIISRVRQEAKAWAKAQANRG